MFPGMNPKQMQAMMKQLGIQQVEIPAEEVIIKTKDKILIVKNPQVSKVNLMGQETLQIIGKIEEKAKELEISEEDIQTVMEQTSKERETVLKALKETKGNLAEAILKLK